MPRAEDHHHQQHQQGEKPVDRHEVRQDDQRRNRCHRNWRRQSPQRRVRDVPAIQLSEGQQVQCGGQHPEPRRHHHRMHIDRRALRHVTEHQERAQLEQERFAKVDQGNVGRDPHDLRERQAKEQRRYEHEKTGDRPSDTNVEQRHARRECLPDPDHRAQRADLNRNRQGYPERNEERTRRVDVIAAAHHVMPHLVGPEDGEDRQAVPESRRQTTPLQPDSTPAEVRRVREIMDISGEGRGRQRQDKEQHVQPLTVLKLAVGDGRTEADRA